MSSDHSKKYSTKRNNNQARIELERLLEEDGEYAGTNRDRNGGQDDKLQGKADGGRKTTNEHDNSGTKNKVDSVPVGIETTWSSDDESTEMAGSHKEKEEKVEKEINVKWQMPGNQDSNSAKKLLIQLISELLLCYPGEVTFIDRKQREWVYEEVEDEEKFLNEFDKISLQVHPIRNKQQRIIRWVAITKIRCTNTIQDWKNDHQFYCKAVEAKTYVFPHPFGIDEWDVVSIGFLKDIHAVHYPRKHLHNYIYQTIKNPEKTTPTFQLIPQRIANSDKTAHTRAYTVQCLKTDAKEMIHLLTHGQLRNTQIFIPFKYKASNPELFTKCIRQQNEVYYKTWIIKLEGVTDMAMPYIHDDITQLMGVFHIVPTRRTKQYGEWKVLTDQAKCAYVHRQLATNWQQIIAKIPQSVLAKAPAKYSTPKISSKKVREYQDTDSDNDSYGSLLTTGTDVSVLTTDDSSFNELPADYQYPSYASAAAASTTTASGASPQVSSPTASTYSEWRQEKQALEAQIAKQAQQIEKIQADLNARVSRSQDLEDKLAQALDLAHERDLRHAEMLENFRLLMATQGKSTNQEQEVDARMNMDEESTATLSTPPRTKTVTSPPSKKANTNASPHRNIYALFRPPAGRQPRLTNPPQHQLGGNRSASSPQHFLTQPMDTDDTNNLPSPGAKSGQKLE